MSKLIQDFRELDRFFPSSNGGVTFKWRFGAVGKKAERRAHRALYRCGGSGRKTIMKMLSKKAALFNQTMPRKYTHNGELTPAYKQWREDRNKFNSSQVGQTSAPRRRTGLLWKLVLFKVNKAALSVRIGPKPFTTKRVRPKGSPYGADLLNEGGPAMVRIEVAKGQYQYVLREYRRRPYIQYAFARSVKSFTDIIKEEMAKI